VGTGVGRGCDFGRTIGWGLGLAEGRLRPFTTFTLRPLRAIKSLAGSRLLDLVLSFKIGLGLDTALGLGVGAITCCGREVTTPVLLGDGVAVSTGATKSRPAPWELNPSSGAAPYSTSRKRPVSSKYPYFPFTSPVVYLVSIL